MNEYDKAKKYFNLGFTFWNEYDMFFLFTSSGTFLGILNTFYHKYFGYVRVLAQVKN